MSVRLSTGLPRACSGLMYAAVPRIIPACVIAGVVIVGDCVILPATATGSIALASPKSSTFTRAVGADLDIRGFQIAMDDPLLVRRFERLGDLLGDGQRLVEGNRASRNALRQILALDEFHDEGVDVTRMFEAVNDRDVGMVQRGQGLGLALEAGEAIGIVREGLGQDLDRDVAVQFRIARAKYLPHPAFADLGRDFVNAEAGAGSQGQSVTQLYERVGRANGTTTV